MNQQDPEWQRAELERLDRMCEDLLLQVSVERTGVRADIDALNRRLSDPAITAEEAVEVMSRLEGFDQVLQLLAMAGESGREARAKCAEGSHTLDEWVHREQDHRDRHGREIDGE